MKKISFLPLLFLGMPMISHGEEISVSTAQLTKNPQALQHTSQGVVSSPEHSVVSASHAARLDWIAQPGTQVKAGDIVARQDTFFVNNKLQLNQLKIDTTANDKDYLSSELTRLKKLQKSSHVAQNLLDELSYRLTKASIEHQQAQITHHQLTEQLQRSQLISQVDGVITRRLASTGTYTEQGTEILQIVSHANSQIVTMIPVDYASLITPGDEVVIRHQHLLGSAKVNRIVNVANQQSQAYTLYLTPMPQLASQLMIGTRVDVELHFDTKDNLMIPQDAIVLEERGQYVYRIQGNKAQKVPVEVIGSNRGQLVVRSELQPGDQIVIRGSQQLSDGAAVRL